MNAHTAELLDVMRSAEPIPAEAQYGVPNAEKTDVLGILHHPLLMKTMGLRSLR